MKRWSVDLFDGAPALWWSTGPGCDNPVFIDAESLYEQAGHADDAEAADALAALGDAVRDAGRLRGLAATFASHLNANQTFTGAQIAAMLNSKAEVL